MANKKMKCTVKFGNDKCCIYKPYCYLTDMENLQEGDLIVVDARGEFTLAYFDKYLEFKETENTKWIIDKVDLYHHNKRMKKAKEIKRIKEELEKERKLNENIVIYKMLAESNPYIKNLLEELEALQED